MSEPNAVMFVRNYLIERDEALAPGEADDGERMESAREIVEGVRKSLSASIPAEIGGLVERLEEFAKATVLPIEAENGERLDYTDSFLWLAASTLRALSARNGELREALDWAIAEIEGRTRYGGDVYSAEEQFNNALDRARAALSKGGNGNV